MENNLLFIITITIFNIVAIIVGRRWCKRSYKKGYKDGEHFGYSKGYKEGEDIFESL